MREEKNHILNRTGLTGLFYSDENNLIFKKINYFKPISEEKKIEMEMLPFKFLGPVYMTDAENIKEGWRIDFVEATLYLTQSRASKADQLQSFFSLNSNMPSMSGEMTYLSAVVSTPHTEDIKPLYEKMIHYIHPSIVQGQYYQEIMNKGDFKPSKFINKELERGVNLLEYNLGSARKVYLTEHQKFYCIGLITNIIENDEKKSIFYTFDKSDSLCESMCLEIPSYYIISTLPSYYERLIKDTLQLFEIQGIEPNLRTINLSFRKKQVIYIEEYSVNNSQKQSIGAVLIPATNENSKESKNISMFRKILRSHLDKGGNIEDSLDNFNPQFSTYKWFISSEEDLTNIKINLDKLT